jgi:hypothetical protein
MYSVALLANRGMGRAARNAAARTLAGVAALVAMIVAGCAKEVPRIVAAAWCTEFEDVVKLALWHNPFYLEPGIFVPAGDELLMAGAPNFSLAEAGFAADSVFGVIVRSDGAKAVAVPIPEPVAGHRAVARGPGSWLVAFAAVLPGTEYPRPRETRSIWLGTLDREGWQEVREVFVPDEGDVVSAGSL